MYPSKRVEQPKVDQKGDAVADQLLLYELTGALASMGSWREVAGDEEEEAHEVRLVDHCKRLERSRHPYILIAEDDGDQHRRVLRPQTAAAKSVPHVIEGHDAGEQRLDVVEVVIARLLYLLLLGGHRWSGNGHGHGSSGFVLPGEACRHDRRQHEADGVFHKPHSDTFGVRHQHYERQARCNVCPLRWRQLWQVVSAPRRSILVIFRMRSQRQGLRGTLATGSRH